MRRLEKGTPTCDAFLLTDAEADSTDPPDVRDGEYTFAVNVKYSGSWECGVMSGEGTLTTPLGVYEGYLDWEETQ